MVLKPLHRIFRQTGRTLHPVRLIFSLLILFCGTGLASTAQTPAPVTGDPVIRRGERPPVDLTSLDPSAYEAGRVYVLFSHDAAKGLEVGGLSQDKSGYVITGIMEFDRLGQKYGIGRGRAFLDALYAASPASVQFQERHIDWGFHQWYEFEVPAKTDIQTLVRDLKSLEVVEMAEPVYHIRQIEPVVFEQLEGQGERTGRSEEKLSGWIPNDPLYANHQWHLNNTGQMVGGLSGTPGSDIGAPLAWDIAKGNPAVIVAVIDDGVHVSHPDLAPNMWAGVGYNFVDDSPEITPDNSHGTHVAGVISAVTNNGVGMAGIAGGSGSGDGVRIMTCQIFTESGSGNAHLAMVYAADNGAAISQNSWGYMEPNVYNQFLLDAIDYFNANGGGAALQGGITIFAAGNNNSESNWYPAYYSGAIAVAATDNRDQKAGYSNYGSWISVSAPGNFIGSTAGSSGYGGMSGTSAACPVVSGVAALLASYAPGSSASQVISVLLNNVDNHYPLNPGYGGKLGTGRISAARALSQFSGSPMPVTVLNPASFAATPVSATRIDLSWVKNASGHQVMLASSATGGFGSPSDGNAYNPGANLPGGGTVIYRGGANGFSHTGLEQGTTYYYRIWSFDADNTYSSGISTQAATGEPNNYFITASAGSNGSINPSGLISVPHGGSQTFTITPDEFFQISNVIVNGTGVGAVSEYTFSNVTANQTIAAEFSGETFLIHATAGPNGRISPSGQVAVTRGSSMTFNMVADAGYVIGDVLVNGESVGIPSSYTFENVTANQTIAVHFAPISHMIVATAGANGQIIPGGEVLVSQGSSQTFEIIPDPGYAVDDVVVDGESAGALTSYTFSNVRASHTISAGFKQVFLTILSSGGPNGTISPSGGITVPYGEEITFYFTPEPGYMVASVLVDGVAVGQPESYTFSAVADNHSIEVEFEPVTYSITATAGEGGMILPEGQIPVTVEETVDFEIIPGEGYLIDDILVDGESRGPAEHFSFSGVIADRSIHAVFRPVTYQVVFTVNMEYAEGYDPEDDGVFISGSMFEWAEPGSLPELQRMVVDGDDPKYLVLEMELPAGDHTYKYFLNAGVEGAEWPGEPYRRISVPDADTTSDFFGYMTDPTYSHLPDRDDWLRIFPNPATDVIFVESQEPMQSISLMDLSGRMLIMEDSPGRETRLNIRELPAGVYVIRAKGRNGVHTSVILINR